MSYILPTNACVETVLTSFSSSNPLPLLPLSSLSLMEERRELGEEQERYIERDWGRESKLDKNRQRQEATDRE